MPAFAQRYIVSEDPKLKLAGFDPRVRDAILAGRLLPGMTRDQVVMTIGWPISSENPRLEASIWRYWLSAFGEYQLETGSHGGANRAVVGVGKKTKVIEGLLK